MCEKCNVADDIAEKIFKYFGVDMSFIESLKPKITRIINQSPHSVVVNGILVDNINQPQFNGQERSQAMLTLVTTLVMFIKVLSDENKRITELLELISRDTLKEEKTV